MAEQKQITTEQLAELAALDGSANARLGTLGKGLVGMVSRLGKAAQDDVNAMGLGISDMQARLNAEGAERIRAMRRKLMGMHKRLQNGPTKQLAEMQTGLAAIASKLPRESFPVSGEVGAPVGASRVPPAVGRVAGLPSPGLPGAPTLPGTMGPTSAAPTNPPSGLTGPNCPPCTVWAGLLTSQGAPYTGQSQALPPGTACPAGWRAAGLDCNGNTICTPVGTDAYSSFTASTDPACAAPPTSGLWYCVVDAAGCGKTTTQDITAPLGAGYRYVGPYPDSYIASLACAAQCDSVPAPLVYPPTGFVPPAPPPGAFVPPTGLLPPPEPIQPPPPGSDLCACVVYLADRLCACLRPSDQQGEPVAEPQWEAPPVEWEDWEESDPSGDGAYAIPDPPRLPPLEPFIAESGAAIGGGTVALDVGEK